MNLTKADIVESISEETGLPIPEIKDAVNLLIETMKSTLAYRYFGKDINVGDLLMIPCQGAYTYSLGQNFIKPLPDVVKI